MDFVMKNRMVEDLIKAGDLVSAFAFHRESLGLLKGIMPDFDKRIIEPAILLPDLIDISKIAVQNNIRKVVVIENKDQAFYDSLRLDVTLFFKRGLNYGLDELHNIPYHHISPCFSYNPSSQIPSHLPGHIPDKIGLNSGNLDNADQQLFSIYISKDRILVEKMLALEKIRHDAPDKIERISRIEGKILGYPQCCIDFYCEMTRKGKADTWKKNTFERTKYASYLLNNILPFRLIPHFPCSYGCERSIKMARSVLKEIKNIPSKNPQESGKDVLSENPELTFSIEKAEKFLKMPVLFFDFFRYIVFDGRYDGKCLRYKRVYTFLNFNKDFNKGYFRMFYQDIVSKFKDGDNFTQNEKEIVISKDGDVVHILKKSKDYSGILINWEE